MAGQEEKTKNLQGRASQKNRTRAALVAAARTLLNGGKQFSVSDAAEAAGISRATAYRYFPTRELLLAELALFATDGPLFPQAETTVPLPAAIGRLVRRVGVWCYANEQPLRTMLRLSLDPQNNIQRPGHRSGWIADALAPGRDLMTPETYGRLSKALTLLLGIDPVVVMKDIAEASRDEALDALEWTARTLVSAAVNEASTPKLPKGVSLNKGPKSTRKTRPVSS